MKQSHVVLHYGRGSLPLPAGFFPRVNLLAPKPQPLPPSEEGHIGLRIARPAGSLLLSRLARRGDRVAIAISDITRYSATELVAPCRVRAADAAGIPRDRVTLFVARGTDVLGAEAEVRQRVGLE